MTKKDFCLICIFFVLITPLIYAIEIDSCQVITEPHSLYTLNQDIFQPLDNSCIIIFADDVTIDCQGHSITSQSEVGIAGIYSKAPKTTVKNCNVSNIPNGWGIYITSSDNSYISNNVLNNNKYGIHLNSSSHNTLINNIVNNNDAIGVYLFLSSYNNITNNTANYNFYIGLEVVEDVLGDDISTGNYISGNEFCFNGGNKDVFCKEDQTFTNNFCCCGSVCGGTCLPCPQEQSTEVTECKKLIKPNTLYKQMNDLVQDVYRDCIIIAAENITYDCQGYSIMRSIANATNGIYSDKEYTKIKNCNIEMGLDNVGRFGIDLSAASHSKLTNNNLTNNWRGIYVWEGKDIEIVENNVINSHLAMQIPNFVESIKIINNTIINSSSAGIQFTIIDDSLVDGNLIENCGGDGMVFRGEYNNITNNIIKSTDDGIMVRSFSLSESRFNKIINNTVTFSSGNGIYLFGIWTEENEVINNTVMYNKNGLELRGQQNSIIGNIFCSNTEYDVYCHDLPSTFIDNKWDTNNGCGLEGASCVEAVVCGDGNCDSGENCPQDNVSCIDDVCYEPTCTNGCGQTAVSARGNDEACISPLMCDGAGSCVECVNNSDCDDGVGCTNDICVAENCQNNPVDANCDDGLYCNGQETCDAINDCQAGIAPSIDDGVSCTIDNCDEVNDIITHTPDDSLCLDGLWCNGAETCDVNLDCQLGTAPDCDDNIDCTIDSCDEGTDLTDNIGTCEHDTSPCACTTDADCNDNNPCTDDICKADLTCQNTPDDTNTCNDGLFCTINDGCSSGSCIADSRPVDDGVTCTVDSCDEDNDKILHIADNSLCDDNLYCNGQETCDAINDCQAGIAPSIDDGVSCTIDNCDEVNDIITHTPDDSLCLDGLWCNGAEYCDAILDCQLGTAPDCDDNIDCTIDSCDEDNDECVNLVNDANCDNSLWCDGDEYCNALLDCQNGVAPDCSDGNECTDDICNDELDQCENPNLAQGTLCGQARDCPDDKCNGFFAEFYPADGHDSCDGDGNCVEYSCAMEDSYCTDDDPNDGVNYLICGAECDEDSDCDDTECDDLDGCYSGIYRDYSNVPGTCLGNCSCNKNSCDNYINITTDSDGDGYDVECEHDCDDDNASIHPGAAEICNDGIDQDCSGNDFVVENYKHNTCNLGCLCTAGMGDFDNSGFCAPGLKECNDVSEFYCLPEPGNALCWWGSSAAYDFCDTECPTDNDDDGYCDDSYSGGGGAECNDCDDTNSLIYLGAPELCNGLDDDCDTFIDEGFTDTDGDGEADCIDPDDDNDSILDIDDNCPFDVNPLQEDSDGDGIGDVCDPFSDQIELKQGEWKLISIPRPLIEDSFNSIFEPDDLIMYYEGGWNLIDTTIPPPDDQVVPLWGYWAISQDNDEILDLVYDDDPMAVPPQRQLIDGWNLIGYGDVVSRPVEVALASIDGKYEVVLKYDNGWKIYVPLDGSDFDTMDPSVGYWVSMKEEGILEGTI